MQKPPKLQKRPSVRKQIFWSFGVSGLLLLASTIAEPPKPILVWNASASAPTGLYFVHHSDDIAVGDMVVAWPPKDAHLLAAKRHYIPINVPLVKRVAAVEHDWVCAIDEEISIGGLPTATRRKFDGQGRLMPWPQGCDVLREGQFFLLMDEHADAFDGRYFGLTKREDIIGKAHLIWRR